MRDGLYRVCTPDLCAGFVVRDNKVVSCADVLIPDLAYWMTIATWISE